MNDTTRSLAAAGAVLALLATSCAKPPLRELELTRRQVRSGIEKSQATLYAPQSARAVQDSLAAIEAAIAAQEQKLPFLRKYEGLVQRMQGIDAALEDMRREAQLGKETMRTEALTLFGEAAALADSVEGEYQAAPAVKGGRTMLGLIQDELSQVRALVTQGREAAAGEQVSDAHGRAVAARERARRLLDEVRSSKAKVQALRARRAG